ncbi:NACHT domain-containing protein [Thalassobaculum salexigens]|uniref:NACHT domain-containing protein n=1 Tax=Thalassobaculum salexigens TaxID=455360 RepID=UPI000401A88C|nr:XRE family transcriptional regulator [Thalassobaculum salexigens]
MPLDSQFWHALRIDDAFAQRLATVYRALRKRSGTQDAVAAASSVGLKSIERIEQGKARALSVWQIEQLAQAIGTTADELIESARPSRTPISVTGAASDTRPHVRFLGNQELAILNAPLLPGARTSFRFLWPDLVISAPVQFHRNPLLQKLDALVDPPSGYTKFAILGTPGSGKTTALRLLTLQLTHRFVDNGAAPFPIYIHARDIDTLTSEISLSSMRLKLALEEDTSIAWMVDGLDEVGPHTRTSVIERALSPQNHRELFFITCRSDVFAELEYIHNADAYFDEIAEMRDWDFDQHVLKYASDYFSKMQRSDLLEHFQSYCDSIASLRLFVINPFHLTLVIYLIHAEKRLTNEMFLDRFSLYDQFYKHWIYRERTRGTSGRGSDSVVALHIEVARLLYTRRSFDDHSAELDELVSQHSEIIADTAFSHLFQWHYDLADGVQRLDSFRHETLLEYILAAGVLRALTTGANLLPSLSLQYNNDVNSFIRSGLLHCSTAKRKAIERRLSALLQVESLPGTFPGDHERITEQAIYYLGRLDLPQCPDILISLALHSENSITRRAASLGAILYGDLSVERVFIEELLSSSAADILNRSVQLAYFGDVSDPMFNFVDDGAVPWTKVRETILTRLSSHTSRDIHLRLWDLVTLRSFLTSRPTDVLSREELQVVANATLPAQDLDVGRGLRIQNIISQIQDIVGSRI